MTRFVRPMELENVAQVSNIEREAFPPPWPATNFGHDLMHNKLITHIVACEGLLEDNGQDVESVNRECDIRLPESGFGRLRSGLKRLLKGETAILAPSYLVLGFASIWFVLDEAHISNIAVLELYRRQGIGEQLLISMIKLAIERNARYINLEVRVSNRIAQALYDKYGFEQVGMRYGYYSDNREDAILMTADEIHTSDFKESLNELMDAYTRRWGIRL